jgi:hypothetical protein
MSSNERAVFQSEVTQVVEWWKVRFVSPRVNRLTAY